MAFMDCVSNYAGLAMDFFRRAGADYVKPSFNYVKNNFNYDFFKKRPELIGAAALAAYWAIMPGSWHQTPGHDHERYCKRWEKYVDLGIATIVPSLLDNMKSDWHNYIVDAAVDFAVPDNVPRAREKERTAREYLRQHEINNKIRSHARLALWYDILDGRIHDTALLPKMKVPERATSMVEAATGVPVSVFKNIDIDETSLLLTGWSAWEFGGGMKAFFDRERLVTIAAATGVENISSAVPTISLQVGYEISRLARKHVDEVYKAA